MTIAEISKMSINKRLQTREALWDSLTHETIEIDSPEWHTEILTHRRQKIENDSAEFISLNELKLKK